jgi:hypothetical protein
LVAVIFLLTIPFLPAAVIRSIIVPFVLPPKPVSVFNARTEFLALDTVLLNPDHETAVVMSVPFSSASCQASASALASAATKSILDGAVTHA